MTSSTVSRLSAPRSSMKLAFSVTFSGSTPRCSTTIFFTRSGISLIAPPFVALLLIRFFQLRQKQSAATDRVVAPARSLRSLPYFISYGQRPGGATPVRKAQSDHCHTAIDVDRRASDIGGLIRRQIDDGGGDIVRCAKTSGRHAR